MSSVAIEAKLVFPFGTRLSKGERKEMGIASGVRRTLN
jgi:hypothetical protein